MERYTRQQFTWDIIGETDERYKQGVPAMPVTKSSLVEDPNFVSAVVVRQGKLPREYIDHHVKVLQGSEEGRNILQGLGIIGQTLGK